MLKRMISWFLCLLMLFSLLGCSKSEAEVPETPVLQAGFAREDITPQLPVPMGGYGNSNLRMSEGVDSQLYATCIAFTYADERNGRAPAPRGCG